MDDLEIALANNDRVTIRVRDTFVKVDADHERSRREAEAIARAPIPVPTVLWHQPGVLALARLRGQTLGRLGQEPTADDRAWRSVGRVLRRLHDAPLPPWGGQGLDEVRARLDRECRWLIDEGVLPAEVVDPCRVLAEDAVRPWEPVFVHGDLHLEHVFVDGLEVTGIIDWSEAGPGDAHLDVACLTMGNPERLDDVLTGYGPGLNRDVVRAWWALRCLVIVRWLMENGYGAADELPEVDVLRSLV